MMNRYDSGEILPRFEEIYCLMRDVYMATNGGYPALEWAHDKPYPDEEGWEERFREIYAPFLRWRLENEIDELITLEDPEIIGVIGINHPDGEVLDDYKRIFHAIGRELDDDAVFLEILALHPSHWGKGYGRRLLESALRTVKDSGKKACGITFPDLQPALSLYESMGAEVLGKLENFSWDEGDRPADYLIIRFI